MWADCSLRRITSITVSTRGNRCEHSGIWYNLEGYYKYYLNASYYQNLYGIQVSLDQSQLDTVNQALANADHWSVIYNCTSFSAGLWNAVCSDTLCAGVPETPADLKADMLRKYPDKTVFGPTVPYDYIVYYGTSLTPVRNFPDRRFSLVILRVLLYDIGHVSKCILSPLRRNL